MRINTIIGGRSWKSCKIYDVPNKAIILCALAFRFISNISLGSCLFVDGAVVNANYKRMAANRARNGLSQILNSFLLSCNFINKILYILYCSIAPLRFLLHHCC